MVFKKDINKILLYLIAVHIVLFTGFSIYYQASLKELTYESNKSKSQVDYLTNRFVLEQLNETMKLREVAQMDRQTFEQRYYDVLSENERLKKELSRWNSQGCR